MNHAVIHCLLIAACGLDASPSEPDFNRDIRPLLTQHCFRCHGRDEVHREAELRLDIRSSAVTELESGTTAIVAGKPSGSELLVRITSDDPDLRMPPADAGDGLTEAEADLIRKWILAGAAYAEHWSFEPPHRQAVPPVTASRNSIDGFIVSRLQGTGLEPAQRATRQVLVRRLSLDLRGLPPTPAEVERFVGDSNPAAYEQLVDRLLHDPAFGERWARLWLDLARYADSSGYGSDPLRKNMWRYRDWVIDALNQDLPYDQFGTEQLAGDLLPHATLSQQMATAFHRNTMTNTEGGTDDEEFRVAAVKDRIETTIQVWMGLTLQCANCHDHKYDPISQRDYYGLFAAFNQTKDTDLPDESPKIAAPLPWMVTETARITEQISNLQRRLDELKSLDDVQSGAEGEAEPGTREKEIAELDKQIESLEKSKPAVPQLPVLQELPVGERRPTHLMVKGNFLSRGDAVVPALPARFAPLQPTEVPSRLGVAQWLFAETNPLTARVAVNRIWSQLFGIGLVETEEDFGTQGEPPSHPELLDWLASEYVRLGWDTKRLLKLIVGSHTYQQSSASTPQHQEIDPRNRLLARGPRFRLDAETMRDQALALAGLLSRKQHGPSVHPYQPPGLWRAAFNSQRKWPTSEGEDRYRRGIYTFLRRTVPYPAMETFDAPSRELCTVRRIRTNTPLQALVTLNDPVFVEAAQHLAARILREGGPSTESRVRFGLQLCLVRPATPQQIAILAELVETEMNRFLQDIDTAREVAGQEDDAPQPAETAELAAWTAAASVLLNLDGVLTKG